MQLYAFMFNVYRLITLTDLSQKQTHTSYFLPQLTASRGRVLDAHHFSNHILRSASSGSYDKLTIKMVVPIYTIPRLTLPRLVGQKV